MRSTSHRSRHSVPRLEALEDRCVPTVTVGGSGGLLTLTGDGAADRVEVRDTGGNLANNMTAIVNGITIRPNRIITRVEVRTGGGDDKVVYNLLSPLTSSAFRHDMIV